MSDQPPNVLCIIDTLARGGGAERLLADLLPELRRRGVKIEVAALFREPDDHADELESAGITVHQLDLPGLHATPMGLRKLRALTRERGFTLFWGHLYYGNLYAWLARLAAGGGTLVTTIHSAGYSRSPPRGLRQKLAAPLESLVLASADVCVAVSRGVGQDYEAYFGLSGIEIVYNGIDCAALGRLLPVDRAAVRTEYGVAEEDFLTVTPASLSAVKGHATWIEAVERLRDYYGFTPKVLLFGNGPLKPALAVDIERRGLAGQVVISPVIPHTRLMRLVAAADAVVMPSHCEAFGLVAVEAMALGVSCVLTDVNGFLEIAGGVDGALLVPPGDPAALAQAVDRLHREPGAAAERAARAKAHVEATFDIGHCADCWAALLNKAAMT